MIKLDEYVFIIIKNNKLKKGNFHYMVTRPNNMAALENSSDASLS